MRIGGWKRGGAKRKKKMDLLFLFSLLSLLDWTHSTDGGCFFIFLSVSSSCICEIGRVCPDECLLLHVYCIFCLLYVYTEEIEERFLLLRIVGGGGESQRGYPLAATIVGHLCDVFSLK